MATTTTNLGLTKPSYSDTADIAVINENMDKLDTAVNASEAGLAIMSNNNNHAAISKGQYVYVRKHGTLSEGLYKATANIATNGTLSSSNVTTVGDGLGGEIAAVANDVSSLSDQIANLYSKYLNASGQSSISISGLQAGQIVVAYIGSSGGFASAKVYMTSSGGVGTFDSDSVGSNTITGTSTGVTITTNISYPRIFAISNADFTLS